MVELMKIMVTSFKRSHQALLHSVAPTLQQVTTNLCLCRDSWTCTGKSGSVFCGVMVPFSCGSWCIHCSVCAFQKSISPVLCKSGSSMVGLMVTSFKRAYATSRSTACRVPALQQSTAHSYLLRRHSDTVLSQSLLGLWVLVHTRYV